jgi:hypothetical protein
VTLPPLVRDWREDARFEWRERVAMRLERWAGTVIEPRLVTLNEREAEDDVRREWARRSGT